jgi:hypothetical protein
LQEVPGNGLGKVQSVHAFFGGLRSAKIPAVRFVLAPKQHFSYYLVIKAKSPVIPTEAERSEAQWSTDKKGPSATPPFGRLRSG